MNFSITNIAVVFQLKLVAIIKNLSVMVAPLLAIAFVTLINTTVPIDSTEIGFSKVAFILGFGLNFNIIMGGIMMGSQPLADEKEKQTLRVLLGSSISQGDFFIGSFLPPFLISSLVNLILVPLAGGSFSKLPLVPFFLLTSFASLISILLGFVIGIYAKTQIQATIISFPLLLLLTMVPSFSAFSSAIDPIVRLLYSGILIQYLNKFFLLGYYQWSFQDYAILLLWLLGALGFFLYALKKNDLTR